MTRSPSWTVPFDLAAHLPDSVRIPVELEFLERRATIQAAARDPRARETFQEFVAKVRQHGDVDILCRALLGLAYTTNWHDLAFSLQVLDEVLVLCEKQTDPIQRDITRLAAYARQLLGSGWNRVVAGQCEEAFARMSGGGDQLTIAKAQLSFSMICLVSSRHREVRDLVESSYKVLSDSSQSPVEIDLATAIWMRYSAGALVPILSRRIRHSTEGIREQYRRLLSRGRPVRCSLLSN